MSEDFAAKNRKRRRGVWVKCDTFMENKALWESWQIELRVEWRQTKLGNWYQLFFENEKMSGLECSEGERKIDRWKERWKERKKEEKKDGKRDRKMKREIERWKER